MLCRAQRISATAGFGADQAASPCRASTNTCRRCCMGIGWQGGTDLKVSLYAPNLGMIERRQLGRDPRKACTALMTSLLRLAGRVDGLTGGR